MSCSVDERSMAVRFVRVRPWIVNISSLGSMQPILTAKARGPSFAHGGHAEPRRGASRMSCSVDERSMAVRFVRVRLMSALPARSQRPGSPDRVRKSSGSLEGRRRTWAPALVPRIRLPAKRKGETDAIGGARGAGSGVDRDGPCLTKRTLQDRGWMAAGWMRGSAMRLALARHDRRTRGRCIASAAACVRPGRWTGRSSRKRHCIALSPPCSARARNITARG